MKKTPARRLNASGSAAGEKTAGARRSARQSGSAGRTIAVGRFKATCLKILSDIHRTRETLIVTRHGHPLVEIRAVVPGQGAVEFTKLRNTVIHESDIVSPLGEDDWEAAKP